ncbi:ATP-NAD kinase-like domain-containing protein [Gautieria morchelliformis]|nr:ATP-NAD kinase-like domain-containing protein [Gautieria morchelliformis]
MLRISLLRKRRKGLALYTAEGTFDPAEKETARGWTSALMQGAYEGCQPKRRLKIMINPHGGSGKAMSVFNKKVKPVFDAAHCPMDVLVTERHKHCYEHAKAMGLDYDAVVVLSGDGLVHEVFNAFADRGDAMDAFALPVVQIPTGSANGFSIALIGLKAGFDVCAAALNVIKGKPMKLDLCSVQQGEHRIISFMSQAIGMMADIDLGTESMRWMGEARFMIGFLREVGLNRECPMKLEVKIAAQDKQKMVQAYRLSRSQAEVSTSHQSVSTDVDTQSSSRSMPALQHIDDPEGWTLIDKPLAYVYAGKLPYVSRDLMQFPVAICDDGYIDIVAQERVSQSLRYLLATLTCLSKVSRVSLLRGLDGAARGTPYWRPTQLYFKAKAYRLTPYAADGYLALDGEKYPYKPFQVEVHQRLGSTLGRGAWYPEFHSR